MHVTIRRFVKPRTRRSQASRVCRRTTSSGHRGRGDLVSAYDSERCQGFQPPSGRSGCEKTLPIRLPACQRCLQARRSPAARRSRRSAGPSVRECPLTGVSAGRSRMYTAHMDRVLLPLLCLVVAPVAAFYVGSEAAQTAVDASDAPLAILLGGGTVVALSTIAARSFGRSWTRAATWALASLTATGLLWLVLVVVVFVVLGFEPA